MLPDGESRALCSQPSTVAKSRLSQYRGQIPRLSEEDFRPILAKLLDWIPRFFLTWKRAIEERCSLYVAALRKRVPVARKGVTRQGSRKAAFGLSAYIDACGRANRTGCGAASSQAKPI